MPTVHWFKCRQKETIDWCHLNTVDLDTVTESGVYVIWYQGKPGKTVYVGQGDPISTRFAAHRKDKRIQAYEKFGLLATWAEVSAKERDGVERFLADNLDPLVGDAHPDVTPIAVNYPW